MSGGEIYDHWYPAWEMEQFRLKAWGKAACPWRDHRWVRFYHRSHDFVVMIMCQDCGRTPTEGLGEMGIRMPVP